MADKVKVLVVGLSNMGASHASAYRRIVLAAEQSINEKRVVELA
jgi:hypothetical protein